MKNRMKWITGVLAATGLTPVLLVDRAAAQIPAATTGPTAPTATPLPVPPDAVNGVPPPGGVLGNIIKAKAYCKARICASPLGALLNSMLAPASAFSGGIIPQCCPPNAPNPADLAKPADSAEGAAARIKADTAGAAARRAAVRYLATVDCHYWPEAQLGLANALRQDRNECVRLEAALALARGCCCTRITVEALSIAVSGSNRDGNPAETCERVRAAAMVALEHCLNCLGAVPPPPLPLTMPPGPAQPGPGPRPESPSTTRRNDDSKTDHKVVPAVAKSVTKTHLSPAEYYKHIEETPWATVVANARKTLKQARTPVTAPSTPSTGESYSPYSSGEGSGLIPMLKRTFSGPQPVEYSMESAAALSGAPTSISQPQAVSHVAADNTAPSGPAFHAMPVGQPMSSTTVISSPAVIQAPAQVTPSQAWHTIIVEQPEQVAPQLQIKATTPAAIKPPAVSMAPTPNATVVSHVDIGIRSSVSAPAWTPAKAAPIHETHIAQVSYQVPSAPRTLTDQLVAILQNQPEAAHRAWAASYLATVDGWTHPAAVQALVRAARTDKDVSVRVACIRSLGHMQVTSQLVLSTIQELHADANPAVQAESRRALQQLVNAPMPGSQTSNTIVR